ncbi:efflux RND transporter periplasmic adaptor subunit [Oxalobacteraceae bacterium R-40]|uniref:Efflux RND transporter periplasmic adaptor subunit n=1 Tax=Keguizhuia sedimenti TaxID=3064264 RepID=A0ABU1BT47_9BURK|nr:efflux RND transporter periplasmic adaptor subunit [Oxalobacteraceae bacterium R-40]
MDKKQSIAIAIVLVIGLLAGGWILMRDTAKPGATAHEATAATEKGGATATDEPAKGPHGGKFFKEGDFALEVTIFETGVPPHFRLYLYENDKPLAPTAANVSLTLSRLGAKPQVFNFKPEADYLIGDQVVDEPHSFDVVIVANRNAKTFKWNYSQTEARVEMSDASLNSTGIEILTAGPALIKTGVKLPGEIKFNSERMVRIVPRLAGVVAALPKDIGQFVKKGDVIAVVESQSLADLRSEALSAQKRLALARTTYLREKKLWEEKISAEQDYLAAQQAMNEADIAYATASQKLRAFGAQQGESAGAGLTRLEIRAPIGGLIVAKDIAVGEAVSETTNLLTVADVSTVWAEISVYAKDLNLVNVGQQAFIKATATNANGIGKVSYLGALVGEETRTAKARVTLPNPDGKWRPGLFVDVEIVAEEATVPVAVSVDAIQTVRDWSVVFGRYGQYFEARPLELGRNDGKMVEVLSGLSAGERYGGGNSFAIKAELGKAGATHDH